MPTFFVGEVVDQVELGEAFGYLAPGLGQEFWVSPVANKRGDQPGQVLSPGVGKGQEFYKHKNWGIKEVTQNRVHNSRVLGCRT